MTSLSGNFRSWLYDGVIVPMTAGWYKSVLDRLPRGARVLDVGIGTGSALLAQSEQIEGKQLCITGVDIDADYVARCQAEIERRGLHERITVQRQSIYDHRGGPFDAIYFSGSFMLLPDPAGALRHVSTLLSPQGRIYFTQTFEQDRRPWLEFIKPLLRWVTTIDFGRVTYEADFRHTLLEGGITIDEWTTIEGGRDRSSVLVIGAPSRNTTQP